jgi:hypothetical protein
LDFTRFERKYELYEYDGLLFIARPTPELTKSVQSFLASSDAPGKLNGNTIEVNYSGRDADRWVVSWLKQVAAVVTDAAGEVTCTITTDDGDPLLEFFRITDGKLVRQRGQIQRAGAEVVV